MVVLRSLSFFTLPVIAEDYIPSEGAIPSATLMRPGYFAPTVETKIKHLETSDPGITARTATERDPRHGPLSEGT
jgi:hypothetical protein